MQNKLHKERLFNNHNQLVMVREFYKTKKGVVITSVTTFEYLTECNRKWSEKLITYYFNGLLDSDISTELSYHENGKIKRKNVRDTEFAHKRTTTEWFDNAGRVIKRNIRSDEDGSSVSTRYAYDEFGNQYIDSQTISATSKYADILEILGWFSWTKDGYY